MRRVDTQDSAFESENKSPGGKVLAIQQRLDDNRPSGRSKLVLPVIAIIAVLTASGTYGGWAQTPGGLSPYWQGCNYPLYTAFLVTDAAAFVFALLSVVVVLLSPLQARPNYLVAATVGTVLMSIAIVALMTSFFLSGFVAVGLHAPKPDCATLNCSSGGLPCALTLQPDVHNFGRSAYVLDPKVVALNNLAQDDTTVTCYHYTDQRSETVTPEEGSMQGLGFLLDRQSGWQRFTICSAPQMSSLGQLTRVVNLTLSVGELAKLHELGNNSTLASVVNTPGSVSYSALRYNCFATAAKWNTLCDLHESQSKSVGAGGQYMTVATMSSFGGVALETSTSPALYVALLTSSVLGGSLLMGCLGIFLVRLACQHNNRLQSWVLTVGRTSLEGSV